LCHWRAISQGALERREIHRRWEARPSTVITEPAPMVVTTTETASPAPVNEEGESSAEELDLSGSQGRDGTTDAD